MICSCLAALLKAPAVQAEEQSILADWGPLVVHFDKNESGLSDGDKAKISELLQQHDLGETGHIFVVGYTDSTGARKYNYKLSRRRAQQVRQSIISLFDLDPHKIIAVGQGPESPVADNGDKKGRARNRRAEIYLSHVVNRELQDQYRQDDPQLETIDAFIEQARRKLLRNDLTGALVDLRKARAAGGDRYSSWHTLYGIAGFFTDAPLAKIRAHLQTALRLDADNVEARNFLGRVEARQRVASGQVTASMGRSVQDAIAVISMDQQAEYLMLFGVEPVYHHELEGKAVDVWECRDRLQAPVAYYFDHSQVFAREFGAGEAMSQGSPAPDPSRSLRQPVASEPEKPGTPSLSQPQQVWQSRIFR